MGKKLHPVLGWLDEHLEETLLIALLVVITLLTGLQVLMRKVFDSPLSWSEELCRYCFMASGFIGVPYCIRKRCEICITTFTELLPKTIRALLTATADLLCAVAYGVFCAVTVRIIGKAMASGQISPAIGIPNYFIYGVVLAGFGLALLRTCVNLAADARAVFSAAPPERDMASSEPQT